MVGWQNTAGLFDGNTETRWVRNHDDDMNNRRCLSGFLLLLLRTNINTFFNIKPPKILASDQVHSGGLAYKPELQGSKATRQPNAPQQLPRSAVPGTGVLAYLQQGPEQWRG